MNGPSQIQLSRLTNLCFPLLYLAQLVGSQICLETTGQLGAPYSTDYGTKNPEFWQDFYDVTTNQGEHMLSGFGLLTAPWYAGQGIYSFGMGLVRNSDGDMINLLSTRPTSREGQEQFTFIVHPDTVFNTVCYYSSLPYWFIETLKFSNSVTNESILIIDEIDGYQGGPCRGMQTLNGPLVGYTAHINEVIDLIKFHVNTCPCSSLVLSIENIQYTIEIGQTKTFTLNVSHQWSEVWPNLQCSVQWGTVDFDSSLEIVNNNDGTFTASTDDTTNIGNTQIAFYASYTGTENVYYAWLDVTGCEAYGIAPITLEKMRVELEETLTVTLAPDFVTSMAGSSLTCTFSFMSGQPSLYSFNNYDLVVSTNDYLLLGTHWSTAQVDMVGLGAPLGQPVDIEVEVYGCEARSIDPYTLGPYTIEIGQSIDTVLGPTVSNVRAGTSLSCPISYSLSAGASVLSIQGGILTVSDGGLQQTRTESHSITITLTGDGMGTLDSITVPVEVTIEGCEQRTIDNFYIEDVSVELTTTQTISLTPTVSNVRAGTTLECPLSLSSDWPEVASFSGFDMSVSPDASIPVGTYEKKVTIQMSGPGLDPPDTLKIDLQVTVYGCERHSVNTMTLSNIVVEMADPAMASNDRFHTETLTPTHSQAPEVTTLDCPLALSTTDGAALLTFSGFQMTVATQDPSLVGSHSLQIVVTMTGHGDTPRTSTSTLKVRIKPRCQLSEIQLGGQSAVSMSSPVYGNVYQDLAQLYTHEYVTLWSDYTQLWPDESCVLSYELDGGDRSFISVIVSESSIAGHPDTLHLYSYQVSDEGSYSIPIVVSYGTYPDSTAPTQTLTSAPISVTVEPICPITSFTNNAAISTTLRLDYLINVDGPVSFPFEMAFEPASCNFIKSYMVLVDGAPPTEPSWISVNADVDPAHVLIETNLEEHEGVFSVQIWGKLNTTPGQGSTDAYEFTVSLADDKCSRTVFDGQALSLAFEIEPSQVSVSMNFPLYTYTTGSVFQDCGSLKYELVQGYSGLAFDPDSRTFTFSTIDPAAVGTHEIAFLVELVDHTQYNPYVRHIETFWLTVTAACLSTTFQYTPPAKYTYVSGSAPYSYSVPSLTDTVSLQSNADGFTYCGQRTILEVSKSPAVTFDTVDTFEVSSSLDSEWGVHTITFGVTLDLYSTFEREDFSFEIEIVPDCASSLVSQSEDIAIGPVYKMWSTSLDFAGVFTHEYEGSYGDYCGPLEYLLDFGSATSQTYLSYDSATTLTLAPSLTDPEGNLGHSLRARLRDFPTAYLDAPVSANVIGCDVTGHYIDTFAGEPLDSARQDMSTSLQYYLKNGITFELSATFDDIQVSQGTLCADTLYTKEFVLLVDGIDVSAAPPAWITSFWPTSPALTIQSTDNTLIGSSFTVRLQSFLTELGRQSDTALLLTVQFEEDPCLTVALSSVQVQDMAFTIDFGAEQVSQMFDPVTEPLGCGPVSYELESDADFPPDAILVDPGNLTITVWTDQGQDSWVDPTSRNGAVYSLRLVAYLSDYPQSRAANQAAMDFAVTIDSVCFDTVLANAYHLDPVYYQEGSGEATLADLTVADTMSLRRSFSYYELCGPRKYSYSALSHTKILGDSYEYLDGLTVATLGTQITLSFIDSSTSSTDWNNRYQKVTIEVALIDYPQIYSKTYEIDTFFVKKCTKQTIGRAEEGVVGYYAFSSIRGGESTVNRILPFQSEIDTFFLDFGATDLADSLVCGRVTISFNAGSPFFYTLVGGSPGMTESRQSPPVTEVQINQAVKSKNNYFFSVETLPLARDVDLFSQGYVPYPLDPEQSLRIVMLQSHYEDYPAPYPGDATKAYWEHNEVILFSIDPTTVARNLPPQIAKGPECDHVLVAITEDWSEATKVTVVAQDDDSPTIIMDAELSVDRIDFNKCPHCLQVGGDNERSQGSLSVSLYAIGVPEYAWQSDIIVFWFSDFIARVTLQFRLTFVPLDIKKIFDGKCPSLEEVAQLAPDDSLVAQDYQDELDSQVKEAPVELKLVYEVAVTEESDIAVQVEIENDTFDLGAFFDEYFMLLASGSLEVGNANYNWVMEQLRQLAYPVPIVIAVTNTGQVQIYFSRPIRLPYRKGELQSLATSLSRQDLQGEAELKAQLTSLAEADEGDLDVRAAFNELLIASQFITLTLEQTYEAEQVVGQAYFGGERRRNLQSQSQQEVQGQEENSSETDWASEGREFKWTVSELTDTHIFVDVDFKQPGAISAYNADRLRVEFNRASWFLVADESSETAPSDLSLPPQVKRVPQQLQQDFVETVLTTSSTVSNTFQAASLVNLAFSIAGKQSLQPLWGAINYLSLVVNMPLNNVKFPFVVNRMFEELIKYVTFDILESLAELSPAFELNHDVSPTVAFGTIVEEALVCEANGSPEEGEGEEEGVSQDASCEVEDLGGDPDPEDTEGFAELGYDSSEPVGLLGTANFMIAALVLQLLWFFTPRCCCPKSLRQRKPSDQVMGEFIRFNIEMAFEMIICVGAVFWPRDASLKRLIDYSPKTLTDKYCIAYTVLIAVTLASFILLTAYVTICRQRPLISLNKKYTKVQLKLSAAKAQKLQIVKRLNKATEGGVVRNFNPQMIDDIAKVDKLQAESRSMTADLEAIEEQRETVRQSASLFSEFFAGMNETSQVAQYYHLVYLLRRICLALSAFGLRDHPWLQMFIMVMLGLLKQLFLVSTRVFADTSLNKTEVGNDFFVYVCSVLAAVTPSLNAESSDTNGLFLVLMVVLSMLLNFALIAKGICTGFIASCKAWYVRYMTRAHLWETRKGRRFSKLCDCQCNTCGQVLTKGAYMPEQAAAEFRISLSLCDKWQEATTPEDLLNDSQQLVQNATMVGQLQEEVTVIEQERPKIGQVMHDDTILQEPEERHVRFSDQAPTIIRLGGELFRKKRRKPIAFKSMTVKDLTFEQLIGDAQSLAGESHVQSNSSDREQSIEAHEVSAFEDPLEQLGHLQDFLPVQDVSSSPQDVFDFGRLTESPKQTRYREWHEKGSSGFDLASRPAIEGKRIKLSEEMEEAEEYTREYQQSKHSVLDQANNAHEVLRVKFAEEAMFL